MIFQIDLEIKEQKTLFYQSNLFMRLVIIQNLFFMSTIFHCHAIFQKSCYWMNDSESFRPDKHSLCEQMVQSKEVVLCYFSRESEVQIFVSAFHIAVFGIRSLNQRN